MIPVKELKTHGYSGSKNARIEAMGAHFETGRIWIDSDNDLLIDEYMNFPDLIHDDVLDSVELMTRLVADKYTKRM